MRVLISAGEASGDLYASALVQALRRRNPETEFFGCAGPRMQQAGVRAVVDARSLNVVGLVEVVRHIPGIYREFRKLVSAARQERPDLAILTDSPDFHLRLGAKLRRLGIPVIYLIAPQIWAWRKRRIKYLCRDVTSLLCIFPFEEEYFRSRGVPVTYIGHPLTRIVRPLLSREEFFKKHRLPLSRPIVTLLPGSRPGEIGRHLRILPGAVDRINAGTAASFLLATPSGLKQKLGTSFFTERIGRSPIQHIEGETWDAVAHSDVALAASGTVTIEAAILGTPMIAFYKVSPLSWWIGRHLVDVPFFSMVNLVAGRRVIPELIQNDLTEATLASEALALLSSPQARDLMRRDLAEVTAKLTAPEDPIERAAELVGRNWNKDEVNVAI